MGAAGDERLVQRSVDVLSIFVASMLVVTCTSSAIRGEDVRLLATIGLVLVVLALVNYVTQKAVITRDGVVDRRGFARRRSYPRDQVHGTSVMTDWGISYVGVHVSDRGWVRLESTGALTFGWRVRRRRERWAREIAATLEVPFVDPVTGVAQTYVGVPGVQSHG